MQEVACGAGHLVARLVLKQLDDLAADHDGVSDCQDDLCPGTQADAAYHPPVPLITLAPSRWQLEQSGGQFVFSTTMKKNPIPNRPTIAETHGCSCKQILDRLRGSGRGPVSAFLLLDQYLFGCTRGTLESWSNRNR